MLDFVIAKVINNFAHGTFLDKISWLISYRLFLIGAIAVIVLIILWKDKKYGKYLFIAFIIAAAMHGLFNEVLWKEVFADDIWFRERPYVAHPDDIFPIGNLNTDNSFPSNHLSFLTLSIVVICYFYRKRWVWFSSVFAIILMSLSRIHNGMHYPTDILGGIITGMLYGIIGIEIADYIYRKQLFD